MTNTTHLTPLQLIATATVALGLSYLLTIDPESLLVVYGQGLGVFALIVGIVGVIQGFMGFVNKT